MLLRGHNEHQIWTKYVYKCTWNQETLGPKLVINFLSISSDLQLYSEHLGEEKSWAVSWSLPGLSKGGWCWTILTLEAPACKLSTPGRALTALRGRLKTMSLNEPCSAPAFLRLLHGAVVSGALVHVVVVIPKADGGDQRWRELSSLRNPIQLS